METNATGSNERDREDAAATLLEAQPNEQPNLPPTASALTQRKGLPGIPWTSESASRAAKLPRRSRSLWNRVAAELDKGDGWSRATRALYTALTDSEHPAYGQALKLASERWDAVAKYVVKQELRTSYRINDNDAPRTIEATPASPQLTTGSTSETSSGPIQEAVQQRTTTPATELPGSALAPELPVSHPATGGVSEIATGAPTDLEQLRAEVHDLKALTRQLLEQNAKLLAKLG